MARKEAVPVSEQKICARLREFRASTKIPRTAFALIIGISSERLASYELGRVPLRFGVFKAIHRKYYVNPGFLVQETGPMAFESPLDLSKAEARCDDRALLSWCYRQALGEEVTTRQFDRFFAMFGPDGMVRRVEEYAAAVEASESYKLVAEGEIETMIARLSTLLEKARSYQAVSASSEPSE